MNISREVAWKYIAAFLLSLKQTHKILCKWSFCKPHHRCQLQFYEAVLINPLLLHTVEKCSWLSYTSYDVRVYVFVIILQTSENSWDVKAFICRSCNTWIIRVRAIYVLEREKSNIHHRQIAKRNKVMTSRFSKLKCDLHGKYQAPLEPLLQFCIWRNVKKKQDKNKVKHRLIFLSVLFHYFFHWFKKPKTRDLEKLCSTTQTEHKPLIALITWCLQNQDVHYGKVSCLWKRENNYKLMRANMMNLK